MYSEEYIADLQMSAHLQRFNLIKILEELKQTDYELFIRTQNSHLSEEQWDWLINNTKKKLGDIK